jgi:hypothetical protein
MLRSEKYLNELAYEFNSYISVDYNSYEKLTLEKIPLDPESSTFVK